MATTNRDRVGRALELLRDGLSPFIERESADTDVTRYLDDPTAGRKAVGDWDVAALLRLMWEAWNNIFQRTLGRAERSMVQELRDWRNKWAHQEPFSGDDTYRVLDSVERLLTAVSAAPQAEEVTQMKAELLRVRFDEQTRSEKRKAGGTLIEAAAAGNLKPWREVVTPHADVASGRYQQAEFAADLWQVHIGEGTDEYRNPAEFFRRTFLTESLQRLLVGGVQRLTGHGGDPVVQLQTNFGGGKTHSMLALYHLFSGAKASDLAGVDAVLAEAGVTELPTAKRVVLVGNKLSPGNPITKPDGTVVRTLWGELAYQLGGAEAFARVAADDEKATSPGDTLRELFNDYGPCLILVDEWVAYARQLHDSPDLPGGTFETQFTFAQALTESAKAARNCLLLISLPASDTAGSPHTQADDVEVGGIRGREALDRLRNVVGRVESSWRPASAEEGFEIVRRRLFEALPGPDAYKQRDLTARAFMELYQSQKGEFPPESVTGDYEKRIQAAYPIHPEIFDRLYTDWSTLVKFQRTRGVLRLMAAVIHSLWEKGDRNPLILPSTIPIDDSRVQFELTRYLSDNWVPIIARDVDGPNSLPLQIDNQVTNLGKLHATRRVARTIYLGSAPTSDAAQRGLEDRRVRLGCVMPGESPQVFGDAVRRLAAAATYLYQDGARYWYSTQPTVTKLAEDRAIELARDTTGKLHAELLRRLELDLGFRPRDDAKRGDFTRIHLLPRSGADVPDDLETKLVVLDIEQPYTKEGDQAEVAAKAILESRGSAPRIYRNTLVFLAADKVRLQDLDEALRKYLAWQSIVEDKGELELAPSQVRQAEQQKSAADSAVAARIPETFQWVLVPSQKDPKSPVEWKPSRLTGSDALAIRTSRKLRNDDLLVTSLGATIVRKYLDDIPLWRGEHVPVRQVTEDFAQQLYLPRVPEPSVLAEALRSGVAYLTWQMDTFAYAESYDEGAGRYRGLRGGEQVALAHDDPGLLVKADVAYRQLEAERSPSPTSAPTSTGADEGGTVPSGTPIQPPDPGVPAATKPRRYHGTVRLDPARTGRDASQIAEEILAHLIGLAGAEVTVTLDIEARFPDGASEQVIRTVTENGRTLKFDQGSGFERE